MGAAEVFETAAETPPTADMVSAALQLHSGCLQALITGRRRSETGVSRAVTAAVGLTQEVDHEWRHAEHGSLLVL
jgi:hypothetical protein